VELLEVKKEARETRGRQGEGKVARERGRQEGKRAREGEAREVRVRQEATEARREERRGRRGTMSFPSQKKKLTFLF
jgi:hypothetical protein